MSSKWSQNQPTDKAEIARVQLGSADGRYPLVGAHLLCITVSVGAFVKAIDVDVPISNLLH